MSQSDFNIAILVFFATLAMTFALALFARFKAGAGAEEDLAHRSLNKWFVGLSAATTGNSGFIVTGAVGLGYAGGVQWLLLPLSWLIGDLVYWSIFPQRLNELSRRAGSVTLSEVLTADLKGPAARGIVVLVGILLAVFLTTYAAAQWLAGEKILAGVVELTRLQALGLFGLTIVAYSAIGGFRGSVYVDAFQAIVRLLGTAVAVVGVVWVAMQAGPSFQQNIAAAGPDFLKLFPAGVIASLGLVGGYACAAVGFGLGQPQIVTRYMAGSSPEETRAARWIYIGFLQATWLSMTGFGVMLRGVMPGIEDAETGLSVFFQTSFPAVLVGVIFADIYATIASTSNGLLVAISQIIRRDLLGGWLGPRQSSQWVMTTVTLAIGLASIGLSFVLPGNVFTIAIAAVSQIGAALAGPMMIKVFGWRHTAWSLLAAIASGIAAGMVWHQLGWSGIFNEAGVGIAVSLAVNAIVSRAFPLRGMGAIAEAPGSN